ncbi:23S rRNA (uracil(1939)-C(5))-methyltransferase RlmD [Traorella massiliensis]|uniref:23S rRNA (uracil(1939)-C(5))-methyltransferase RlmD n=1 Tax=Traorella massiliensis TaxID=1903263 RepID=UPI0008F8A89C|nr:23S rRNA (uracil(1939)-C(5))-methyltransferase RlmD [Traorella massiliensis]
MKIEIKKSGINGEGIGYVDRQPVFVEGALPSETVEAEIIEKNKTYMTAKTRQIIHKSKHRCTPKCHIYKQCKACSLMIADYELQCQMKEENLKQSLMKYASVSSSLVRPIIKSDQIFHYRNACKIPFGMEGKKLVTGMFQPNSNYFTPIEECIVHDKQIERIRKEILIILNDYHYKAYDSSVKKGFRTLAIRLLGNHAQVTLVTGEDVIDEECVQRILKIPSVISLWQSIHTQKKTVEIFGNKMIPLSEKRFLDFDLKGVHVKLSPRSFFQLNTQQANRLYDIVKEEAGQVNLLVEAYSGIGGISFTLRDNAKEIIGIESVKDAVVNANMSAKENRLDHMHFICDDAAYKLEYLSKHKEIDMLVVDPPRSGLDENMLNVILRSRIKKIIYISCNPATLGKNLAVLKKKYQVNKVIPLDMFPQTAWIESVTVLTRK